MPRPVLADIVSSNFYPFKITVDINHLTYSSLAELIAFRKSSKGLFRQRAIFSLDFGRSKALSNRV